MQVRVLSMAALFALVAACGSSDGKIGDDGVGGDGGATKTDSGIGPGYDAGPPVDTGPVLGGTFVENFTWKGNHASSINGGKGTTVWWNPDAWDMRGDTEWQSTQVLPDPTDSTLGNAVDIHKAASADPSNPTQDNGAYVVGGDGSPGLGVMSLSEQDILSARLRNPMVISASKPGIITFRAARFVTTGHWWEIAITPASRVTGGEYTPVPSNASFCSSALKNCNDGLDGPVSSDDGTPGPGHRPAEEAINLVLTGWPDIPTCSGMQYYFRAALETQFGNGPKSKTIFNKHDVFNDPKALPVTKPEEINYLYAWRAEYRPDGIDLYGDMNKDGSFSFHEHFAVAIPWSEVHVQLLGIAYQADHHPQKDCGWVGKERDIVWRNVTVSPMKYSRTSVAPHDTVTKNVSRETGCMGYDIRDTLRFGPPVKGVPQANAAGYQPHDNALYASDKKGPTLDVSIDITADQAKAAFARFLYDIEGTGTATLTINGKAVSAMPTTSTVACAGADGGLDPTFDNVWVRRGIDVPLSMLKEGANTIHIETKGTVYLDRLQLEFSHVD